MSSFVAYLIGCGTGLLIALVIEWLARGFGDES